MRPPSRLHVEARRAAWDRLWKILLTPPAPVSPSLTDEDRAPFPADSPGASESGGGR